MMAAGGMAAVRHLCMSGRSVKSPTPDILLRNRYKKQLNVKTWTRDLIRPRWSELFYFRPSQGSGKFKRRCTWGGRHAVCDRKYWWFMKGVTGLGANDNGKSTHTLMLLFVEDSAVCSCSPPSQENLSWGLDGGLPRPSRASYSLPDLIWSVFRQDASNQLWNMPLAQLPASSPLPVLTG